MTKQQLTKITIRTIKVINSCKTWEQCEVAEKYMKLALKQISKYYRNNFKITKIFKNVSEELGIVADFYDKLEIKYSEAQEKRIRRLWS